MYKIISKIFFYAIAGLFFLFSNVTLGQTATENYTKSITYLTETPDGNVSEEEMLESIVYYDGLNRPKQSIAQRSGGNMEDLVTPIFYDQFGRQSIEYLPLPVENNNGDFYIGTNGNISGEIKSYYKQKFPNDFYSPPGLHPDWDNPYNEKIFENSPISKVVEYAAPGYDWRNTSIGDHTKKIEYTTNGLNEVKKLSVVYESGAPILQENGYYTDGDFHELIKTINKDENWISGKLNTTETFTDKNGRVILTNGFVTNDGGNFETLSTYFVYDDLGRLIFKIPPKLDGNYNNPSTYDDIQLSWPIHDFISPSNSALEGDVYFSIENDILNMGGSFGQNPSGILATLNLQTTKPLNTNPSLPDMYLGKLIGIKPPPSNEYFHLGEINIINGNLVVDRISNQNFLGLIFSPFTINIELVTNSINKLAFQYRYDNLNRLISQKSPGKGWEEIVYDRYDRPILTRDALLKERGKWMFKKYDGFGRVVYTGIFSSPISRSVLQSRVNDKTLNPGQSEKRLTNPYTVAGTPIYYTNNVYPREDITEIRTVHYYDDYVDHSGVTVPTSVFNVSTQVNTKSLPTVSRVRVLNTDDWIVTITGYDKNAQTIYLASKNEYLQTTDIVKNKIDFSGKLIEAITTHSKTGNATITIQDYYSYDHIGKIKTHQQRIDNEPIQLIAHNSYDEIGQLLDKKVGGELFKSGYTDIVKVAVNAAGVISKTDVSDSWNAGLATIGKLEANGGISFMVPNQLGSFMRIGLSDVNTNPGTGDLDFYYYFYKDSSNDPMVTSYARNLQTGSIVTLSTRNYQINDTFAIEWVGGEIKYIQNGTVTDTFQLIAQPSFLIGDLSFRSPNSMIRDLDFYAAGEINKYLQDVDYKYNVRGWLTDINSAGSSTMRTNDLFNFKINYNESITGNAGDPGKAIPLYDGTISQTIWRTQNTDKQLRSYAYKYDELNRLLIAYSRIGNDLNETDDHMLWGMSYDKNGNILSLRRSGKYVSQYWDNLVYNYDGNRLVGVEDISTCNCKDKGFDDVNNSNQDYLYDINGNLVSDANKNIANITYNDLDLPEYILVDNYGIGGTISYVYDATGKKLQKTYVESGVNGSPIITQYAGNYVYEKNQNGPNILQFIGQPEGYIIPTPVIPPGVGEETKSVEGFDTGTGQTTYSTFSYVFQYRDHLGNIRLSYSDINKNGNIEFGDEIIEESNYYPFGIKQWGYNDYSTGAGNAIAQQYKFGGKQLQEELNLQFYDFGSRNYDPALGRWFNPDPKNQFASPYIYGFNNPISSIDPDGELAWFVPVIIGAVIGGASTAIANPRADFGDILVGSAIGAVTGAVTAGIGSAISGAATTTVTTTVTSTGVAVTGTATASLSTTAQILVGAGAHGFFQGTMASVVNGGNFWKGAAIGAGSSVAGSLTQTMGPVVQISAGGVTGGVTAAIQGGDFMQGFATGLIVSGLNHTLHTMEANLKPTIRINLKDIPEGFDYEQYVNLLKEKLISNGFSSKLLIKRIEDIGTWEVFKHFLNDNKLLATVSIKTFNLISDSYFNDTTAGYAKVNSNMAIVFKGLSMTNPNRMVSESHYVHVTAHELGHAIFGFGHENTCSGFIMHWSTEGWSPNSTFTQTNQQFIRESIWGQN